MRQLKLLVGLLLIACQAVPPKMVDESVSTIAITIGMSIHSKLLTWEILKPEKVIFIKLDNDNESLKKTKFIISNYKYESANNWAIDSLDSFAMNIKPGIYAAIGVYGKGKNTSNEFMVFFPEKMVKESIVKVESGSFKYMGKYILNNGSLLEGMKEADDLQQYYYKFLFPKHQVLYQNANLASKLFFGANMLATPLKEMSKTKEYEKKFLKRYMEIFKKTEWYNKIKKQIEIIN